MGFIINSFLYNKYYPGFPVKLKYARDYSRK